MDSHPQPNHGCTTFTYSSGNQYTVIRDANADAVTPPEIPEEPRYTPSTALFAFAHDAQKGTYLLTWPDGKVEVFRDKPVRYLVVEPDPETGEMKPVVTCGGPTYLYLSREEREVR